MNWLEKVFSAQQLNKLDQFIEAQVEAKNHRPEDCIARVSLSDGRVCEIFPLKLWNLSVAADEDMYKQMSKLLSLCTLLDGEVANAQTYYEMYMRDIESITKYVQ